MTELNKIHQIDALNGFKSLPSESIDCIMTSPPYWALRDYGTGGIIWDGNPDCEHEWGYTQKKEMSGGKGYLQDGNKGSWYSSESNFCVKCGAWKGELGLEPSFDLYVKHLCDIFEEAKRVLKKSGTCWVNIGDTYYSVSGEKFLNDNLGNTNNNKLSGLSHTNSLKSGNELKQKSLTLIPFRFAIEMQKRGWICRNVIIWYKKNCMPSSVRDRFTVDFEYLFFFVKNKKYWFEQQFEEISESSLNDKRLGFEYNGKRNIEDSKIQNARCGFNEHGRNKRTVWQINPKPFSEAHFAVYPEELCETPIKAGCPEDGVVCDPFTGSGTTLKVAKDLNRQFIGFEVNHEYIELANQRINGFKRQDWKAKKKHKTLKELSK